MNSGRSLIFLVMIASEFCLFAGEGILVIDDFNRKSLQKNSLNKEVFLFASRKGVIFDLESDRNGVKNECLKITYNFNLAPTDVRLMVGEKQRVEYQEEPVFAGYFSRVSGLDFTRYEYLILYVRGDREKGFSRDLRIELKDKKFVAGYTLRGITEEWQKFVIPVSAFSNVNLKKVDVFGIVFLSDQITKKEGTIYVDEIILAKKSFVKQKIKVNNLKLPVAIDGELSDWKNECWYNLTADDNLEIGKIDSLQDLSARFALQWDKRYLYLAVKVIDNDIVSRETGANIWQDDCVEIYIDPQNDGLVWKDKKDYEIGISPSGPDNLPQIYAWFQNKVPDKNEVDYAIGNYKDGYSVEARIKWDFLNFDVRKNNRIGFSISVHDVDGKDTDSGKLTYCWVKDRDRIFLAEAKLK